MEVDFGFYPNSERTIAETTVTGQTWVTNASALIAIPFGTTTDHDAEDAACEGLIVSLANLVPGAGFDVIVSALNGTWGKYNILVVGA